MLDARLLNRSPQVCPVRSPTRGRGAAELKFDGWSHPDSLERSVLRSTSRRPMLSQLMPAWSAPRSRVPQVFNHRWAI